MNTKTMTATELESDIKNDLVGYIIRYEDDTLGKREIIYFFKELIATGKVWTLQGSYGRTAIQMLCAGYFEIKPVQGKFDDIEAANENN